MAKKKIEAAKKVEKETKVTKKGTTKKSTSSNSKAKKETTKKLIKESKENIEERNIFEYAKEIMLIYGANVNLARSIPNGLDGLKPVERRILYTMYKFLGMRPGKGTKKVARIVGETMGVLHP